MQQLPGLLFRPRGPGPSVWAVGSWAFHSGLESRAFRSGQLQCAQPGVGCSTHILLMPTRASGDLKVQTDRTQTRAGPEAQAAPFGCWGPADP